ncbi:hypothetical protein A1O3_00538 [Capronia epimyces CBS 606.96]|uniref:Uncharacterized protein n=1 Tax=Capronia epimyces CBS 606.96 TaxID=1182542 RepID=W9YHH3_9EURO|nr:uncharacterized protein A1O3_00538 [Capronia epimyces CBS 606.96]EXJ91988.1 hypothetical protein A1O3_00538 [Capronia epimyces CBS 606.96]
MSNSTATARNIRPWTLRGVTPAVGPADLVVSSVMPAFIKNAVRSACDAPEATTLVDMASVSPGRRIMMLEAYVMDGPASGQKQGNKIDQAVREEQRAREWLAFLRSPI